MKTFKSISISVMLLFFLVTSTFATRLNSELAGISHTDFSKYSITEINNPMKVNGEALKTYELTYENTTQTFTIGVLKSKKCKSFIVRSESFEIAYLCNKGVFGVKKLTSKQRNLSASITKKYLDQNQYQMQKIIT